MQLGKGLIAPRQLLCSPNKAMAHGSSVTLAVDLRRLGRYDSFFKNF